MPWQDQYKSGYREAAPIVKWTLGKAILWFLGAGIIFAAISIPMGLSSSAAGVMSRTLDPDNIIYNYEWFHSKSEAYVSYQKQKADLTQRMKSLTEIMGTDRSKWTRADREEYSQLTNQMIGVAQHIRDIAAEYNARTGMANRSIFKSGDLPESLPIE